MNSNRTPEKAIAFCSALAASGGNITRACEAIGIPRRTAYEWRESDPAFAAAWDKAKEMGLDALEDEVLRRAFEGVDEPVFWMGEEMGTVKKYSDTLAIFLLKGGKPDKYRERSDLHVTGQVDIAARIAAARKRTGGGES